MSRRLKSLVGIVAAIAMGGITLVPRASQAQSLIPTSQEYSYFLDLANHWASPFIYGLAEKNLLTKISTFEPDQPISRAQLAGILERTFPYQPILKSPIVFEDVPSGHWAAAAIQNAYGKGFLSGYGKFFRPDEKVTRVQVMTALANGLSIPVNLKRGDQRLFLISMYKDFSEIPEYAIAALGGLTDKQIIVNYPDIRVLSPNRPINRAELATLLYQALVNTNQLPKIISPQASKYVINPDAPLFDVSKYSSKDLITRLEVNLSRRQVIAFRGDVKAKTYPIGVGRTGWETPTGSYRVQQIIERPAWKNPFTGDVIKGGDPDNPLGGYWIGFWTNGKDWSGFHATSQRDSVGKASSHGCIRMYKEDIKELFAKVTPVTVVQVTR